MRGSFSSPELQVARFVGPGGRGASHPVLMQTEDGQLLHIKLLGNPQSSRSLAHEWIGTHLGLTVGAPFPTPVRVFLATGELSRFPELGSYRWRPGQHFATYFLADAKTVSPSTDLTSVTNWHTLPHAALVENWLANHDLKPSHILMHGFQGNSRLVITDHGYAFGGPRWTSDTLRGFYEIFLPLQPLTRVAWASLRRFSFEEALAACEAISAQDLWDLVNSVPEDWKLSRSRREVLVDFLTRRQLRLPNIAVKFERIWNRERV